MTRLFCLVVLLGFASCTSPVAPGQGHDMLGTWRYSATQNAPTASLTGTLTVTSQTGSAFSGRLEVQETDAAGQLHTRAGATSGHALIAQSIDFDVLLGSAPRRHVARLAGDSIQGNWVEASVDGFVTGTFHAVRLAR